MLDKIIEVSEDNNGLRLDRFLRNEIPSLKQSLIEKSLRKGQIRVNGKKESSSYRIQAGDQIKVPESFYALTEDQKQVKRVKPLDADDVKLIKSLVIYENADFWVLNKPCGLATQGGTKTKNHVDRLLPGLVTPKGEIPRLVHRLDKDTSGILLIAKSLKSAQNLTNLLKTKQIEKMYWAVVVRVPDLHQGKIDMPLAKKMHASLEKVFPDFENGQKAQTNYIVKEALGKKMAWLELYPLTGRTHQLRVHCAEALGTPIVGDGKYGGEDAYPFGRVDMHLHARSVSIPMKGGKMLTIKADLPPHMRKTWKELGFATE